MTNKKATKTEAQASTSAPLLSIGNVVLVRTAIYHALGKVNAIFDVGGVAFVQLAEASYLGDTGRYNEATSKPLSEVSQAEIEPVGNGGLLDIQIASIGDIALAIRTESKVK